MSRIEPLTDEQIEDLAVRVVTNQVYMPFNVEHIRLSFGAILALAGPVAENAGLVYEDWEHAGPHSINGLPMFLSCKFVPEESVEALVEAIRRKLEALGV